MSMSETAMSPCDNVRRSCLAYASSTACLVSIDSTALVPLAEQIRHQSSIAWDAEAWHYNCSSQQHLSDTIAWPIRVQQERIALYILALDAINFCFWPHQSGYEYEDLAKTLTQAAEADHVQQSDILLQQRKEIVCDEYCLSSVHLRDMTEENMTSLFARYHPQKWVPPDMNKRCALWNEVGTVLQEKFNGSAVALIEAAHDSAPALVRLLVDNFPGFQDTATTAASDTMYFYKRAQICVGDMNAALDLKLKDMDRLTTFADYRVPQLLRHCNVLVYSNALATAVDAQVELLPNSVEEISIRAATVAAVKYLVDELKKGYQDGDLEWTEVSTDWYLWQVGEKLQKEGMLKPHHQVRTIYY